MQISRSIKIIVFVSFILVVGAIYLIPNPLKFTVYYPNQEGTGLVGIPMAENLQDEELYAFAASYLVRGTTEEGLTNPLPVGTHLFPFADKGPIIVDDRTIKISFSKDLIENHSGGSTGELMTVGSIVNTLTSFNKIKYVQIFVEGEPIETLAGHLDLSEPLEFMSDLVVKGD